MNKEQIAEQILLKRFKNGEIGPTLVYITDKKKLLAAIIEAMSLTDSPTDEEIKKEANHYSEGWGESDDEAAFVAGAKWAIQKVSPTNKEDAEAMSINSENVYTKNPCDENVNMSDTTDDAQSNVADNQEAIEPKGE